MTKDDRFFAKDEDVIIVKKFEKVHGEEQGHPFRGNQYGQGTGEGKTTTPRERKFFAPPYVMQDIVEKEFEIQNDKLETLVIFNDHGEVVFEKQGTQNEVDMTPEEHLQIQRRSENEPLAATHNHPTSEGGFTQQSHSLNDYKFFVEKKISEIRVCTPAGVTYVIRGNNSGWPTPISKNQYSGTQYQVKQKMKREGTFKLGKTITEGKWKGRAWITPETSVKIHDETWSRLAEKHNFDFERIEP
jgi:hypothetical protein